MQGENLKLNDIKTVGLFILNHVPPADGENLNLEMKRKIVSVDDGYVCNMAVDLFRKTESDDEKKTFEIKYEVSASLSAINKTETIEAIQDEAISIVYPYVRANLAALTGIACNNSVNLPCWDKL